MQMRHMSLLQLVGNTPLVKLSGFDTGVCELFLKLESQNPGGSIKDRVALSMIADAEERGVLPPGGTIVEATAGNTGLGLALVAAQRGYRCVLVVPDKFSREKIDHMRALGAEIVVTRNDVLKGHPDYYQDKAARIAAETGAWYANQFANPANPRAHELTTGPEILQQMENRLDAVVLGVGSAGTLGGLTACFRKYAPNVEIVIADPVGSIIAPYVSTGSIPSEVGSWLVEGIGEDFIPDNADFSLVQRAYSISDRESFDTARAVLRTNGILAGSSSGTLIAAALRYCREQSIPKRVVTFVCDGGSKYLSKMFSDYWLAEHGFSNRTEHGDLRDLIVRPFDTGSVVSVQLGDTLQSAYARMKSNQVSQLPVLESGKVVGVLDESDLLLALSRKRGALSSPVSDVMVRSVRTIRPEQSLDELIELLMSGLTALVADEERFYGIITKMDVVDFLKRSGS